MSWQRLDHLSIIIVDDNEEIRTAISGFLSSLGAHVGASASADSALAAIKQVPPDLVFSDISMPGKDGVSLLREIRALDPSRGGSVPVIALTGIGTGLNSRKARELGFTTLLLKPFTPHDLLRAISELNLD
jgi:CheY-like chemotaxis protein